MRQPLPVETTAYLLFYSPALNAYSSNCVALYPASIRIIISYALASVGAESKIRYNDS